MNYFSASNYTGYYEHLNISCYNYTDSTYTGFFMCVCEIYIIFIAGPRDYILHWYVRHIVVQQREVHNSYQSVCACSYIQ